MAGHIEGGECEREYVSKIIRHCIYGPYFENGDKIWKTNINRHKNTAFPKANIPKWKQQKQEFANCM
jgi:hypothetical protein